MLQAPERNRSSLPRGEEDRAVAVGKRQPGPVGVVLGERATQVGADGHQSRFEELAIPNGEEPVAEVDVAAAQAQRLARPKSRGVEDQEHEAQRVRLNQCGGMHGLRRGFEQADDIVVGIDVPLEGRLNPWAGLGQR